MKNEPVTKGKILFVDDEPNVVEGFQRQLRGQFDMVTATRGEQALSLLRRKGPFAVVVSDYAMPEMDGVEFLREVHRRSPHTVNVMLTGRRDLEVAVAALNEGQIFRFVQKPCPKELLVRTIQDGLTQHRLVMSERHLTQLLNVKNSELRKLNEELEHRVAQRTASIHRLQRFVRDLNGQETLAGVADLVVATTAEIMNAHRVALLVPDRSQHTLKTLATRGVDESFDATLGTRIGHGIAGNVYADALSVVVNDSVDLAETESLFDDCEPGDQAFFQELPFICAFLVTPSGPVGVLSVAGRQGGQPYESEDLANLRALAEAAAIALRNEIRRQERDDARDSTILALAALAEHRDPDTGAHLERVQEYCRLLAESLGQTPKYMRIIGPPFINTLVRSCPLHDIGKVGIRDDVLLKPGSLSAAEFEIMKQHARIGGDTIQKVIDNGTNQDFLRMGMEIAYHHHEKYNGYGYPDGLAGEEIPLAARIVAVADVYDALTSKRVYKQPMSHEQAVAILHRGMGTHFDPQIVEAFDERAEAFQRIAEAMSDFPVPSNHTLSPSDAEEIELGIVYRR